MCEFEASAILAVETILHVTRAVRAHFLVRERDKAIGCGVIEFCFRAIFSEALSPGCTPLFLSDQIACPANSALTPSLITLEQICVLHGEQMAVLAEVQKFFRTFGVFQITSLTNQFPAFPPH